MNTEEKWWKKIKNLNVEEFTTPCPEVVSPDTKLVELERLIKKKNFRHIPIQEGDKIVGIISERDIFSAYRSNDINTLTARDIMQKEPYIIPSDTKLSEVAFYMSKNKYGSALVTSADGELGIFTSTDALNALVEVLRGDILTSS
ncbi:MAG: CBS domain-containing protein [Bdellovibrionales bacterium]|nr:CBS domain-containing protein [Bdellovibrionales bacterium]